MKTYKEFIQEFVIDESMTTEKVSTGEHRVLWKGNPTKYHIFNGSAGLSGAGANQYGIHNKDTGKDVVVGSLQKAKKTASFWLGTEEKKNKIQEDGDGTVAANAVGVNDHTNVAKEPIKKSGIKLIRRNNKKASQTAIDKNQSRNRDDSEFI